MLNEKIFNPSLSKETKEDIEGEIIEKIKELQRSGEKIGEGLSARVFVCQTNPDICYKINYNPDRFHNAPSVEGEFLEKSKINNKVILPEPFYSISTDSKPPFEVLVMKRLEAVSIKDIIEKNLPIPEKFELEKFFSILKEYFEELHSRRIFHRDIRSGNVMIETKTGKPCVIDFGSSVEEYLSSENPYSMKGSKGDITKFLDDTQGLKEIKQELRRYIFSKSNKS